jgi:hypothetical protein
MIITKEFYDIGGRKYIDIDNVKFKIPWRYNRVMGLKIEGTTLPIQSLVKGTEIDNIGWDPKTWDGQEYKVLKCVKVR